jgi:hypothetical protein
VVVEPDLRSRFDVAVSADPGADPGEMARYAMDRGGRIRHRRRLAVGGSVAAVVTMAVAVGALNMGDDAGPRDLVAAAMRPPAPACSADPVTEGATDAVIYLSEPTDGQVSQVGRALDGDARVASVIFESRAEAYARFQERWKDSPDFVAAVAPEALPVSYRLRLHDPAGYAAFTRDYAGRNGVAQIVGRVCPASAPVGGVL